MKAFVYKSCILVSIALLGGPAASLAREVTPASTQQQPDPSKKKEITASIARSNENETISLTATFPEDANGLKVSLFNLLGKLIDVHPTTSAQKGTTEFRFFTKGLPNGPYIIVLEANGQRVTNKIMVSR